jgi:hypothetical protein
MGASQAGWIGPWITAGVVAIVLMLRLRGTRRPQRLRLETIWITPAIFAIVLAVATWEAPPPTLLGWLWLAIALALGAAIGWRRGKMMRITIDPDSHRLNQQGSPAALLLIVALIVARQGLRYEAAEFGINILAVTGIMMAFTLGLMGATRAEMFVRARRLLIAARSGDIA